MGRDSSVIQCHVLSNAHNKGRITGLSVKMGFQDPSLVAIDMTWVVKFSGRSPNVT